MSHNKVILIGIVVALIAVVSANFAIKNAKEPVEVYTFTGGQDGKIPARTEITESMITKDTVPADGVHHQYVKDKEEILGSVVVSDVYTGQQVISPLLRSTKSSKDLSYYISNGKRAVAIPADTLNSFSGNLKRNDRIDVVGHFESLGQSEIRLTKTILYNVKVLEVAKDQADNPESIVLEVEPDEVEILDFANNTGQLNLALVPDNAEPEKTNGLIPQTFLEHYGYSY